jgi:DHA1 family tetracycline resistance protein-like MFS transporter
MKGKVAFIFVTIMLDMIGIGLVIPTLPDIMRRFTDDPALVSTYFGYFISVYAAMQFIASPLLGALSDRYGRRPILLVSLLAAAADYVLMAFAPTLPILFIGRVISGITGANITVAMAYIADVSDDSNRSANFGLVGAAFGLGFIIGPAIGGLLGHYGPEVPFLVAAGINFLNFLFGLFVLPESLAQSRRIDWKRTNPFLSLASAFKAKHIIALVAVHFLFQLAGQTHFSIWTLYTEHRYGWNSQDVGLSLAYVGLLSALSQAVLTRLLIPKIGEYRAVIWSCLGFTVEFLLLAFSNQGWMMYAIFGAFCVFWISGPGLQSLITKEIPPEMQGELQGSLVSLTSLASIITPLVMTQTFAYFSRPGADPYLPGAPYFLGALICFGAWILMLFAPKPASEKA